jgi:hypothetical protein
MKLIVTWGNVLPWKNDSIPVELSRWINVILFKLKKLAELYSEICRQF